MLDSNRAVLFVTDIQGTLAQLMHDRDRLFNTLGTVIQAIRLFDIPIMWIEQYPQGLGPTVPEVACHLDGLEPLPKKTFSSIADPEIGARFAALGRDQAILIGIETHICINQTSHDLMSRGVETHVVADAVSSRTADNKRIGLDKIRQAGGIITSAETCLFELQKVASGETFKPLLKLVK
jgi:isochorismate hydrolase